MLQCPCTICLNTVEVTKKTTENMWNYHRDEPTSDDRINYDQNLLT